jgi:formiminotetrahydrofolate cyclodeaminase
MKLVEMEVKNFLDELASNSPAPGGGSVSALAAANGCALMIMVGNLTINKKKFKAYDESIQKQYLDYLDIFSRNKSSFVELIDLDTEAFTFLMDAFKLPKNSEEEIEIRSVEIEKATLGCIKIPMKVTVIALETLRLLESMIEYSNRNTVSDQGVSVLMLYSAIEGAAMNVLINLPGLSDEKLKKEYEKTISDIIFEANNLKDSLLEEIKYLLK